jgi:hypothetical protein
MSDPLPNDQLFDTLPEAVEHAERCVRVFIFAANIYKTSDDRFLVVVGGASFTAPPRGLRVATVQTILGPLSQKLGPVQTNFWI